MGSLSNVPNVKGVSISALSGLLLETLQNVVNPEEVIHALVSSSECKYSSFDGLEQAGSFIQQNLGEEVSLRTVI